MAKKKRKGFLSTFEDGLGSFKIESVHNKHSIAKEKARKIKKEGGWYRIIKEGNRYGVYADWDMPTSGRAGMEPIDLSKKKLKSKDVFRSEYILDKKDYEYVQKHKTKEAARKHAKDLKNSDWKNYDFRIIKKGSYFGIYRRPEKGWN